MNEWIIAASLILVLAGTFLKRNIRAGVLAGLLLIAISLVWTGDIGMLYGTEVGNGLIITFELGLLLVGALFFYNILQAHGHFQFITELIDRIPSRLTVALILSFFLVSFLEGIAGFGIPTMLAAPLMLSAGYRPATAILLPLAANTTAVTFGALGIPLKVGFEIYESGEVVRQVLLLNLLPALILPFLLAALYARTEKVRIDWRAEARMLAGAGTSFALPYYVTGLYSIEFPSVAAGSVGLVLFMVMFAKVRGSIGPAFWWKAFWPYMVFVLMLAVIKPLAAGYSIDFGEGLRRFQVFQPGIIFLFAVGAYLGAGRFRDRRSSLITPLRDTLTSMKLPMITILMLVCYTQLVRGSLAGMVSGGMDIMPAWLQMLMLPVAGVSGSFITGSATMSNLLLAGIVQMPAIGGTAVAIALLHTGSALGNAISLQNIVMIRSVVPSEESDRRIIVTNMVPVGVYIVVVAGVYVAIKLLSS
ncbi:MAG: L-lactate permease [Balneolaceae bacterium]|nr:MAG: L-lactate permease [Balneolaceae bacterium]